MVDVQEDATLNRLVVSTTVGLWACPCQRRLQWPVITELVAHAPQCMGLLSGRPRFHFSGSQSLEEVHCVLEAQQGNVVIQDTVWTGFRILLSMATVLLNAIHVEVPNAALDGFHGCVASRIRTTRRTTSTTLVASGLGHTSTLTWWATVRTLTCGGSSETPPRKTSFCKVCRWHHKTQSARVGASLKAALSWSGTIWAETDSRGRTVVKQRGCAHRAF